jgi:membrane protein implicated in regulation of membrane protease activity
MILGIILVVAEAAVPSFFIIWFGLAGILVGVLLLVLPLPLGVQIVLWLGLSVVFFALFRHYYSPKRGVVPVGTSTGDIVGQIGVAVTEVHPMSRGRVHFGRPILGSDEWPCVADDAIPAGARVRVVSVEGQLVRVEKSTD